MDEIWVAGEPALYLTTRERAWRETVREALNGLTLPTDVGLELRFYVSQLKRRGHSFDLDNLVSPVLAELRLAGCKLVDAALLQSSEPGVRIRFASELQEPTPASTWLPQTIRGSVKRPDVIAELAAVTPVAGDAPVAVYLTAHEDADSVTDFGFTGFIKPTIDQLWPVLGGEPGKPHDHRVGRIVVQRSAERASGVSVAVVPWTRYPATPRLVRSGSEPLRFAGRDLPLTVRDFWAWAFSDLLNNNLRGILAEYIVRCALGCPPGTIRQEWAAYDVVSPTGKKVEVKSAAYWQSWSQHTPSAIRFGVAEKLAWDPETNSSGTAPARAADCYVFCLLHHQEKASLDPLDLSQWMFYVLPTAKLAGSGKDISLARVRGLGAVEVDYLGLAAAVEGACSDQRG